MTRAMRSAAMRLHACEVASRRATTVAYLEWGIDADRSREVARMKVLDGLPCDRNAMADRRRAVGALVNGLVAERRSSDDALPAAAVPDPRVRVR